MVLFILNYNANNKAILLDKNVSWIIVKYIYNFEKLSFSVYMAAISGEIWLFAFYGVGSVCFLIALWQALTTCRYLYALKGFTKGRHVSDVPWQE